MDIPPLEPMKEVAPTPPAYVEWLQVERGPVTATELNAVLECLNDFAQNLHRALAAKNPEKSFAFSPASLAPVLGMILRGMDDDKDRWTMRHKMGLAWRDDERLQECLGMIGRNLVTEGEGKPKIRMANGMTGELDMIKTEFREAIRQNYAAEVFASDGPAILDAVNNWVAEKTDNQIPELLEELPDDVILCLINALYFEADWEKAFLKDDTCPQTFLNADGTTSTVMMLGAESAEVAYCKLEDLVYAEKGYKAGDGQELSLAVMMPQGLATIDDLEKRLSSELIDRCRSNSYEQEIELRMPRMDFEYKMNDLKEVLVEQLGLPLGVKLREIHEMAELDSIVQQVKMKVDEEGTTAAAATVGVVCLESCCMNPPPSVILDRPFIAMIMAGDQILFQVAVKDSEFLEVVDAT